MEKLIGYPVDYFKNRKHKPAVRLVLAVVAGGTLALAFPPWGLWVMVILAFALLYLALAPASWPGETARLGFTFGVVFYLVHCYWFYSFHPLALPVALLYIGLWHALWALAVNWFKTNPFYFAAGWVVFEWLLSRGYLAFPWSRISTALARVPLLVQPVAFAGELAWGGLWVLAGCLLGYLLDKLNFRSAVYLIGVLLLIAAAVLGGHLRRSAAELEFSDHRVVLVQPNISSVPIRPGLGRKQKQKLFGMTGDEIKSGDFVIWPESALLEDFSFINSNLFWPSGNLRRRIADIIPAGARLLSGARFYDPRPRQLDYLNGALVVDGSANITGYYSKRIPVPGGEHLPLMGRWKWMYKLGRSLGTIGYRGDEKGGLLDVRIGEQKFKAAVQICFEDAFDYFVRAQVLKGADLLINISNDSWSRSTASHRQHGLRARLRTIETGRPLLRVGNTGLSAIVGPFGTYHEYLPPYTSGLIKAKLPLKIKDTPFVKYGHLLTLVAIALLSMFGYLFCMAQE